MHRANRLITGLLFFVAIGTAVADVQLPGMFSDSMVLQRDIKLPKWGWAEPGEEVTVAIAGQEVTGTADKDGKWRVTLAPLKADSKPEMIVTGKKNRIVFKDVLVGEVWLCGGQSNMQMGVAGSNNAEQEIAAANLPQIRHFQASFSFSPVPLNDIHSKWTVCSPQRVGEYTATGFFFARHLHQQLGVPVGLLNVAKGSMPLQTFTSIASLKTVPSARAAMEAYEKVQAAAAARVEWLMAQAQRDDVAANTAPDADVSQWTRVELPVTKLAEPGIYWMRQQIDIPKEWLGRMVRVGGLDVADCDQAYFNGALVEGGIWVEGFGALSGRWYVLEAEQVTSTKLTLALRILNVTGKPCFTGQPFIMADGTNRIALTNSWWMRQTVKINATEMPAAPPLVAADDSPGSQPQGFYNAAIFPLAPYAIRGALWYQGEGNSSEPDFYALALPAMITDWRRIWGQGDFAVGVVQLPNYHGKQKLPVEHGWSEFREAQYKAVQAVKNAGIAVTIDIGDGIDIHPRNKQNVGKRLALWALATVYGQKDLPYSGPIYKTMKTDGNKVRVTFDHIHGGLQAKDKEVAGFAIAGADKVFHFAQARIKNDSVNVWSPNVSAPVAVRYAWAENPICNLFNQAGLPAGPFRTDDWGVGEVKAVAE